MAKRPNCNCPEWDQEPSGPPYFLCNGCGKPIEIIAKSQIKSHNIEYKNNQWFGGIMKEFEETIEFTENEKDFLKSFGFQFPKDFIFSKQDWIDLFQTMCEFKLRVYKRHEIESHTDRFRKMNKRTERCA